MKKYLLFSFLFLLAVTEAVAGDLKVLDEKGVTRLAAIIREPANVLISFVGPCSETSVSLIKEESYRLALKGDEVRGRCLENKQMLFPSVTEGTWVIKISDPAGTVLRDIKVQR